jgi:hypothetical protein
LKNQALALFGCYVRQLFMMFCQLFARVVATYNFAHHLLAMWLMYYKTAMELARRWPILQHA